MKERLLLLITIGAVLAALTAPPGALAVPPVIDRQWVSGVTSSDATLNAEINANGLQTYYELQIDTTGNFSFFQNSSCPISIGPAPCFYMIFPGEPLAHGLVQPPEFILPASNVSQHVSVNMASIGATLQPSITYHYRAIAVNADGPVVAGPDQTFTTLSAIGPPPPENPPDLPEDLVDPGEGQPETTPTGESSDGSSFQVTAGSSPAPLERPAFGIRAARGNVSVSLGRCKGKLRTQRTRRPHWASHSASRQRCAKLATTRPPAR